MNDLEKLLKSELDNIYDGEQQLVEALAEMSQNSRANDLKSAFDEHREQTQGQIQRLEQVFASLGESPKRKTCQGVAGLVKESQALIRHVAESSAMDLALAGAGRKVEHYEIGSYGSLCTWAKELGNDKALRLLQETLRQEKQAEMKLGHIEESLPKPELKDLRDLFFTQMREIYDGEHLLASALAEMEFFAVSKLLKSALWLHLKQTDKHSKRLDKAFKELDHHPDRRVCRGLEGIIDEAQTDIMEFQGNSALDAVLIAAGQKAEHYEIAAWRSLCGLAEKLGYDNARGLLEDNLREEEQTDKALTLLAKSSRNREAAGADTPKKSAEQAALFKAITHGP